MHQQRLRIVTRQSPLALWQATHIKQAINQYHPHHHIDLIGVTTQGDKVLDTVLSKQGGKGLFVKELEKHLLTGQADIAVHSLKDVPSELPAGLELAVFTKRADPSDCFVATHYSNLTELPIGAIVGTSSLRRQCQLMARFKKLIIRPLRGNVNTRLAKLDNGEFSGIILAYAGLERLSLLHRMQQKLKPDDFIPACGQGTLAIECRQDDQFTKEIIAPLDDRNSKLCGLAERAMNAALDGGCHAPIASYSKLTAVNNMIMCGLVGLPDGSQIVRDSVSIEVNSPADAIRCGQLLAVKLKKQGALEILAAAQTWT